MSGNPFENDDATYLVLVNAEGQHSLWPSFAEIPEGWDIALEETSRERALAYVEENWTDMRPKSLVTALGE
ncbi:MULTISPECIES: MbtH family protein [Nocardiopsis]|uniref:Protein mbtH n=1 Tax=Nocardiopsis sinuspersici TaxID=501010 RepID=A0A1V3C676_9ACTN|nr:MULTISPECIES: MbtH family protein [Nocardiopsis]OOC56255.1 protein mbtH [Nocardiopsis sinuspersici]